MGRGSSSTVKPWYSAPTVKPTSTPNPLGSSPKRSSTSERIALCPDSGLLTFAQSAASPPRQPTGGQGPGLFSCPLVPVRPQNGLPSYELRP